MKVAVSGATGFIGKYVVEKLMEQGVEVILLVRSKVNLDLQGCKEVFAFNLVDDKQISYSDIYRPDVLIYLAWRGLPNYNSLHHIEEELPLHYRFLANLVKTGLPAMLVTGTCFEYGLKSGQLREELSTAEPSNSYGLAKDSLRRQLEILRESHPFNLCWARLFYLYGTGQGEKSLYTMLRRAVENKDKEFPMSQGDQLRDFLPIEQVADLIVRLSIKKVNSGVVNICSGNPVSVRGLVENWIEKNRWNIKPKLGVYPYPDYESRAFWGCNRKLKSVLADRGGEIKL